METSLMTNPASKITNKRFLKTVARQKKVSPQKPVCMISERAVNLKNRTTLSLQTKARLSNKQFTSTAVMTEPSQQVSNEYAKRLIDQKKDACQKLDKKRAQMIELNLRYIDLKEKYDLLRDLSKQQSNQENLPDFSNVSSVCSLKSNKISKGSKTAELTVIKNRLENLSLDKVVSEGSTRGTIYISEDL